MVVAKLLRGPIEVEAFLDATADPEAGAQVLFLGNVRDHHEGRAVKGIAYEAYGPMAEAKLQAIADAESKRHPVAAVALVHRVGRLEVGETSLLVAVSSAHRAEAFACAVDIVEAVKRDVPIWKKESFADGESKWVDPTATA